MSHGAAGDGIGFVGFRTDRFDEMVALFRDLIGLSTVREAPGSVWFRIGADAELHVYANTDPDHAFFTTGPVVGLRVPEVDKMRSRLEAAGLEMITDVERPDASAWCHFRARLGRALVRTEGTSRQRHAGDGDDPEPAQPGKDDRPIRDASSASRPASTAQLTGLWWRVTRPLR